MWCAVGSSNFGERSFETNDEITLGFHDRALAKRLEEIFEDDRKHCMELNGGPEKMGPAAPSTGQRAVSLQRSAIGGREGRHRASVVGVSRSALFQVDAASPLV